MLFCQFLKKLSDCIKMLIAQKQWLKQTFKGKEKERVHKWIQTKYINNTRVWWHSIIIKQLSMTKNPFGAKIVKKAISNKLDVGSFFLSMKSRFIPVMVRLQRFQWRHGGFEDVVWFSFHRDSKRSWLWHSRMYTRRRKETIQRMTWWHPWWHL